MTAASWQEALDRLEDFVAEVEAALDTGQGPAVADDWSAPAPGPLPEALLPRARALLLRQEQAQASVTRALEACRRQQAYTAAVSRATQVLQPPAYIDLTG